VPETIWETEASLVSDASTEEVLVALARELPDAGVVEKPTEALDASVSQRLAA
jgi:hypothetical protein